MNQLATDYLKGRFYCGQISGEELMRRVEAEVRREVAAEIEQLRGERDETTKELAHARERKEWWQKNAEAIAEERGELFRAGEAMFRIGHRKTVEWDAWDAAAQPIRDMIANLTANPEART